MTYIKPLDSIRAIAVMLVIISHWIPAKYIFKNIPTGGIGVDIFFVLSGFLISRILFENKKKAEAINISKWKLIKYFFIRRALRIFPIYYLTIFILYIFSKSSDTDIQSSYIYFITYTSNFYFFKQNEWDGIVSHLWSLAVEEQFYLIWPWVILFCHRKYLLIIISSFIFIGLISQYLFLNVSMGHVLTFTCFDAFGLGALLSWFTVYNHEKMIIFYRAISVAALISFFFFIAGVSENKWLVVPIRTNISIMTVWVIAYIILNYKSNSLKFKFIFNNRILVFVGKISYGLYLYHNIIPLMLNIKLINIYINPKLPDIIYKNYWGQLFLLENTILLFFISWISYVFVEKRFLKLKIKFEI